MSVVDFRNMEEIACYDPCYEPDRKLPVGKFRGMIPTDALEHCPEQDMPWIVHNIIGYATGVAFAKVACYPARKRLPNGENAHCTVKLVDCSDIGNETNRC
jgi:hypothetical protein